MCELISKAGDTSIENKKTSKVDERGIQSAKGVGVWEKAKGTKMSTGADTNPHRSTQANMNTHVHMT